MILCAFTLLPALTDLLQGGCLVLPSLLSSLALIRKSWWGVAPPLLEIVLHRQLDFSVRKLFLHSVIIDDEQVSEVTH